MKKLTIFLLMLLTSCSSTKLVSNWKNPEIVLFHAHKVLIVGMTDNAKVRNDFESRLKKEFERRNVEAIKSLDLFDVEFTSSEQSEKKLSEVEQQLLDKDFDAILFTKIVGSEDKKTFRSQLGQIAGYADMFREDYLKHQKIYYDNSYYDTFSVFHAETALYCICVGKERQVIWRAGIEISNPRDFEKSVDDYIKLIVPAMEKQQLVFTEPIET